jgi:hypothetical protein
VNGTVTSPASELTERLQLYARYVAIVAEQLEALSGDRAERVAELEEERLAAEAKLHALQDATTELPRLEEFLNLGVAALDESSTAARELQERWSALSDGALRSARTVGPITVSGGRYPQIRPLDHHLDRRL